MAGWEIPLQLDGLKGKTSINSGFATAIVDQRG
jgi:hypothetical protein